MKLHKYDEFINESQLQFLLEANISYTKEFEDVLKNIDSPIAKSLLDTKGKEVDINQNYIDINKDKLDLLSFKPEDKVEKAASVKYPYHCNYSLSVSLFNSGDLSDKAQIRVPDTGQTGEIVRVFTDDELKKLGYPAGHDYYLFQWRRGSDIYQVLYPKEGLLFGADAIKSSDISVGRLVRAILKKSGIKFTDSEIEDFVYKYRAEIQKINDELDARFQIVKGKDIAKYYSYRNYEKESGTLGNSCMRYDRCQSYLDIYVNNSQVSLLIFKSKTDSDKIVGRALLWEISEDCVESGLSNKVMDRIYTINTPDEELFKQWSIKNKYWYKIRQDSSEDTEFIFHKEDGEKVESSSRFYIKLDNNGYYSEYPYMDTFKYYNVSEGILSCDSYSNYDYNLIDTDGGDGSCSNCGGNGRVECSRCDGEGESSCEDCSGDGREDCSSCNGSGEQECSRCDGTGEQECSGCDGFGEVNCTICDGYGEVDDEECSECGGTGKITCPDCDGNEKEQCSRCDGDGTKECSYCDGNGDFECSSCDGNGKVECYDCDGEGRIDCPDCS